MDDHSKTEAELREEAEHIRQIILRSWDDHMWNFELMDEEDERWLLRWADHPSAESDAD